VDTHQGCKKSACPRFIGIPVINYDNCQHSHNENPRLGHFWRGIETNAVLLAALRW
jgi:hypothetical protein